MKRILSIILVITLATSLVGCSSRDGIVEQEQPTATDEMNGTATGEVNSASDVISDNTLNDSDNSYSDLEVVAAEFCMSYMNHLKNPYSFTIKSIWAYDSPTGGYHVYVKFTAQNSFGADEVKEITNNVPITDSVLESISQTDEVLSSLNIYVSEGQNERNDGSHGEWLDTDRIQSYIDENYV